MRRYVLETTLVAVMGFSLQIAGCAEQVAPDDTTTTSGSGGGGGSGGSGGNAGSGGVACVAEVCDGVDNNCDGVVDENCECAAGDAESCYSGPEGTQGVGLCKAGMRTCIADTNKFGPCMGDVVPAAAETCNGQDDDCNGVADDGLPDLGCGIGACAVIVPACVAGQPGVCTPGVPSLEICDGIDNNCNQLTDEDVPQTGMACNTGSPGICATGALQCIAAELKCVAAKQPTGELCDDLDNDCNGTVDDSVPGTGGDCTTGATGVCAPGKISCKGTVIDCFSLVPASPEICDGLDNDCDGATDENNPQGGDACATGQNGVCAQGTLNCLAGGLVCTPNALAQPEVCDGADNNCDGQTDEGNPGAGQACSCGGSTVCMGAKLFCQGCTKEVDCNNGLDDDGDGAVDCADSQCALGCDANVPPCPAGQKLLVLASTDVPKTILSSASFNTTVGFTELGMVKRVVLKLDITHTYDSDLDITLKSPNNAVIDVTSDNGGSSDNYTGTVFSDACFVPVVTGTAPFNGCFTPEQPLSAFNDQSINGTWTLTVADDATGDVGTLNSWSLAMCMQ